MKAILKKLTLYIATIIRLIFPVHGKAASTGSATQMKLHEAARELYKNTVTLLKESEESPAYRPL